MKQISLTTILFLFLNNIYSQSFIHGVGPTFSLGMESHFENINPTIGLGIIYSPRINFYEKQNLALSFGIPLSVGVSQVFVIQIFPSDEKPTSSLMYNIPLIVNLNLGGGSTKESRKRFGFFMGGGYCFFHARFRSTATYITDNYTINGTVENVGMRIRVGSKNKNVEVKLSAMQGMNEFKPNIFGVAALFNF